MREPVYLRGAVYWCRIHNPNGGKHLRQSTGCKDRRAAVAKWRELERLAVTGTDSPTHATSLGDALDRRLTERANAGRAAGTLDMYRKKARHLTRLLGGETSLARVDAAAVDGYVATRIREGAARSTVQKELVTLRGALRLARRRGEYPFTLDEVMPEFSVKYRPRERALSEKEIAALLAEFPAHRAATVAFILATAATYPSELAHVRRGDIDMARGFVRIRGTKRESRDRRVPIVGFARPWIKRALPFAPFEHWGNVRRDLHAACDRANIPRCSPNDLRRTMLTLLRARGVEPQLLGAFAGHADSRMVERVYGRLDPEQLAHLLTARMRGTRKKAV
jgi:integrase